MKLHHFQSYVESKEVTIHAIDTTEQLADYLTKPLNVQDVGVSLKESVGIVGKLQNGIHTIFFPVWNIKT